MTSSQLSIKGNTVKKESIGGKQQSFKVLMLFIYKKCTILYRIGNVTDRNSIMKKRSIAPKA